MKIDILHEFSCMDVSELLALYRQCDGNLSMVQDHFGWACDIHPGSFRRVARPFFEALVLSERWLFQRDSYLFELLRIHREVGDSGQVVSDPEVSVHGEKPPNLKIGKWSLNAVRRGQKWYYRAFWSPVFGRPPVCVYIGQDASVSNVRCKIEAKGHSLD